MPPVSRPRALAVLTVALLLLGTAAVLGARAWQESRRSDLQRAMATAPAGSERFSFTDWADVRRLVGPGTGDLGATPTASDVETFLGAAFDRDLTSTSATVGSALDLQAAFGLSPASAEWELFSQSPQGAVVTLRASDDLDFDTLADTLTDLGYAPPDDGGPDGVWTGGADLIAGIGTGRLSPEFQHVALDTEQHLVLTSDSATYLATALEAATGAGAVATGLDEVVDASGEAVSGSLLTGENACAALAMSQADADDQALADQLVDAAGEVNPFTGFAMSSQPDGRVRVAMSFESDDQARVNADSRARLAQGPAVGQGGDFADRFSLTRASADGEVVTLLVRPAENAFVISDLSTGPVLFATC